ncbi:MAG: hypothetical protein ACK4Z5_11740 [Brevundimonas sp.]
MAEDTRSGGGNAGIAFIVGGLVVVVAIIAWFVFANGGAPAAPEQVDVDVSLPEVSAPSAPGGE